MVKCLPSRECSIGVLRSRQWAPYEIKSTAKHVKGRIMALRHCSVFKLMSKQGSMQVSLLRPTIVMAIACVQILLFNLE